MKLMSKIVHVIILMTESTSMSLIIIIFYWMNYFILIYDYANKSSYGAVQSLYGFFFDKVAGYIRKMTELNI